MIPYLHYTAHESKSSRTAVQGRKAIPTHFLTLYPDDSFCNIHGRGAYFSRDSLCQAKSATDEALGPKS